MFSCQHVYCSIREEIFLKIGGKSETKGDSDILFCSFNLIQINKCKYNKIFIFHVQFRSTVVKGVHG